METLGILFGVVILAFMICGMVWARGHEKKEWNSGICTACPGSKMVYFDTTSNVEGAISREKEIKRWRRSKKIDLIEAANAGWKDLSEGWYKAGPQQ